MNTDIHTCNNYNRPTPIEKLSADLKWLNGCVDAFFTAVLYVVLSNFDDPMAPVVGTLLYLFHQCCLAPFHRNADSIRSPRLTSELLMNVVFMLICFDLSLGVGASGLCRRVDCRIDTYFKVWPAATLFNPVTIIITMSSDLLLAVILGATILLCCRR